MATATAKRTKRSLTYKGAHTRESELSQIAIRRVIGLAISAASSIVSTALIIHKVGGSAFGVIALLSNLAVLFSFSDFGFGAALISAATHAREDPVRWSATCRAALRVTLASAAALIVAAIVTLGLGGWTSLLGANTKAVEHLPLAATLVVVLFAVGIPLGLAQRALLGIGAQRTAVSLQAGIGLISLALVALGALTDVPAFAYALAQPAAATAIAALTYLVARRRLVEAGIAPIGAALMSGPPAPGATRDVTAMAFPMLVLSISQPIALYSDRLVLSHASTLGQLAAYSVASQISAPFLSVISATGQSLWPRFERARRTSVDLRRELLSVIRKFAVAGGALAVALVPLGVVAAHLIGGGRTDVSAAVFACFGLFLLAVSAHYPSGMFLTDPSGLRRQAALNLVMLAFNLPLSILLANAWGASGPIFASAVTFLVVYAIPIMWLALRRAAAPQASAAMTIATAPDFA